MNEVPSLEEIEKAFAKNCKTEICNDCVFSERRILTCGMAYAHAIMTGKMKLTDSFRKEEPKTKPKTEPDIPVWCRPGQWVTKWNLNLEYLGVVEDVDGLLLTVKWIKHKPEAEKVSRASHSWFKPVRFRPYTYEEAKGLLGKVMEYQCRDGEMTICLIRDVAFNPFREREVMINHWKQEAFIDAGATIDGIPIGVPEIDEEATKEVNHE